MPLGLLIQGFRRRPPERILPAAKPLRQRYDVVIIGGGGHGLATAYYLAKEHGLSNVAVLERDIWPAATRATPPSCARTILPSKA
jgi:sarcosine oxidase subunit beta